MKKLVSIFVLSNILIWMCSTLTGQDQAESKGQFIHYGVITENTLQPAADPAVKSVLEKEFTIEVIYEGNDCERDFSFFEIRNAYLPITWYEIDNFGDRKNPIINANPTQLKDHTTYIVEDFYFHTDTVHVDFNKSIFFESLYPNPSSDEINLVFSITDEISLALSIFDTNGKKYFFREGTVNSANNRIKIPMHEFSKGIYLLSVRSECFNETLKLVHLGY
jgi:hypothetical protein